MNPRCAMCGGAECEHARWRERMNAITARMRANPHRSTRDNGVDGHFRNVDGRGFFIQGVERESLDLAFRSTIPPVKP